MRKETLLNLGILALAVVALLRGAALGTVLVAAATAWIIFRAGWAMLGMLARPTPEPPPAGELRRVRITYRCPVCGTEVRMTMAADEDPEPPRHCQNEMDLVTPVDDI